MAIVSCAKQSFICVLSDSEQSRFVVLFKVGLYSIRTFATTNAINWAYILFVVLQRLMQ